MAPKLPQIPDHLIAFIGGYNIYPSTYFALWKGGHLLVVQAQCLANSDRFFYVENPRAADELQKEYFKVLETVQSLIDTIEFERTNWAYLTQGSGGYRLQQRRKSFPSLKIPLWAPMIYDSEITWKKFLHCDYRIGEWKGREVDVYRVWDGDSSERLNTMLENYRNLEGLDATFPLIGHLLHSDGTVIGLVAEPSIGREVEKTDRSLIYDFVSKLQKRGFLFSGILVNSMLISEGKVKIIQLYNKVLTYYPPERRAELEQIAAKKHWGFLGRLFSEERNSLWPVLRGATNRYVVFATIPSPEKLLYIQNEYRDRRRDRRAIIHSNVHNALAIATRASLRTREGRNWHILNNSNESFMPERYVYEQRFNPYRKMSWRLSLPLLNNNSDTSNSD